MSMTKIKRLIDGCESQADLREVIKAANRRSAQLSSLEIERAGEVWESLKGSRRGDVAMVMRGQDIRLAVAPPNRRSSIVMDVEMLTGMILKIVSVQPRSKRLWAVGDSGETFCLTPQILSKLRLQVFRDELTAHVALEKDRKRAS